METTARTAPFAGKEKGTSIALEKDIERDLTFISEDRIMADDLTTDGLENQAKGAAKQVEGKARNAVGGITGDTSEQLKGKAKDLEGKAQRKLGEKEVDADN